MHKPQYFKAEAKEMSVGGNLNLVAFMQYLQNSTLGMQAQVRASLGTLMGVLVPLVWETALVTKGEAIITLKIPISTQIILTGKLSYLYKKNNQNLNRSHR